MEKIQILPYLAIPGMDLGTLVRVLRRNGFEMKPRYLGRTGCMFFLAILNSILARFEQINNGRKIEATQIEKPPVFIIGHWRSGTTHLHNLLGIDHNFTCPTAYQTMFPRHFCYSQRRGSKLFNLLVPNKRPMDNMAFSASVPWEEEFAIAAISTVSPYMRFLFPVTGDNGSSVLAPDHLSEKDFRMWKDALTRFLKTLTFSKGKQIILKSPPNMGRIATLMEMFPGAKFIHIVRNPYAVYVSTVRLWKETLSRVQLQTPNWKEVEEMILSWYTELFALFEHDRPLIPAGSFHELKFEELVESPLECLEQLYAQLNLPDFAYYRKRVSLYLKTIKVYNQKPLILEKTMRDKIAKCWKDTFEHYDYPSWYM